MTSTGGVHGVLVGRLAGAIAAHVEAHDLGEVLLGEAGFILDRDPDTVRAPDIAFVRRSRADAELTEKFWPGAPDLAVEVLSPSDTLFDLEDRVGDLLRAGALLVWLVHPRRRTVTVHRPDQPPRVLAETEALDGEDVITGFSSPLSRLFRGLRL